ncbi:MAG: GNAT family N-acetyltransferase [Xanthomonadales bacterium]|jgi:ribosomal-protein-serine acetyltransferase|nr:GNAT family N-acetyltransferase [Xanthomonadales bacterium]
MNIALDPDTHLELIRVDHAAAMFRLIDQHRPYLQKWLGFVDRTHSVADVLDYAEEAQRRAIAGTEYAFAIFHMDHMVGRAALHKIDTGRRTGELAAWLAVHEVVMLRRARPRPGAERRGTRIVDQAMRALISFGFNTLQLKRIEIRTAVQNAPANAVAKRLNFTLAGIIPQSKQLRNTHNDVALYYLDAADAGASMIAAPDSGPTRLDPMGP